MPKKLSFAGNIASRKEERKWRRQGPCVARQFGTFRRKDKKMQDVAKKAMAYSVDEGDIGRKVSSYEWSDVERVLAACSVSLNAMEKELRAILKMRDRYFCFVAVHLGYGCEPWNLFSPFVKVRRYRARTLLNLFKYLSKKDREVLAPYLELKWIRSGFQVVQKMKSSKCG